MLNSPRLVLLNPQLMILNLSTGAVESSTDTKSFSAGDAGSSIGAVNPPRWGSFDRLCHLLNNVELNNETLCCLKKKTVQVVCFCYKPTISLSERAKPSFMDYTVAK